MKNKIVKILLCGMLCLTLTACGNKENSKEINKEKTQINETSVEILEETSIENIENNKNFYTFLDTIENIEKLSSAKIDSEIKFISLDNELSYKDLLSINLTGNAINKENKFSFNGILQLNMNNINVNMKFPTYMKNLGTEDFSVILEVPSNYKKAFSMIETENYLKIDKTSKEKLNEILGIEQPENKLLEEISEKQSVKNTLTFTENEKDITTGIYDIEFNQNALKSLYNQIIENENYSKNIFISSFFKNILKNEENISKITKMKGQIAVSKGVATDVYLEIASKRYSMIAIRITLSDINNSKIEEKEYHSKEIKNFDTFVENLIENEVSQKYMDKTMSIGKIYFTGADDSQKIDVFTTEMLSEPINVFINYSKCNPKTNIIIRWFYENQSIQIIENKLNNGDYEDGILKSSITFSDIENVPKGKYRVEVYIEGQENCYGREEFTVE